MMNVPIAGPRYCGCGALPLAASLDRLVWHGGGRPGLGHTDEPQRVTVLTNRSQSDVPAPNVHYLRDGAMPNGNEMDEAKGPKGRGTRSTEPARKVRQRLTFGS